jgi:hypothetical protein
MSLMAETDLTQQFDSVNGNICIECGLCCDGSIFDKGRIDKHDDLTFLKQMGFVSVAVGDKLFFQQPCIGQEGKRCRLYHDERRFKVCKTFKCKLLRQYYSGKISYPDANDIIREIRKRRQSIIEFYKIIHEGRNCDEPAIDSFISELNQSEKMKDPAFRKTYSKQNLDCFIFRELLKRRFYRKNSKAPEAEEK